jgi:hypothetical protein
MAEDEDFFMSYQSKLSRPALVAAILKGAQEVIDPETKSEIIAIWRRFGGLGIAAAVIAGFVMNSTGMFFAILLVTTSTCGVFSLGAIGDGIDRSKGRKTKIK